MGRKLKKKLIKKGISSHKELKMAKREEPKREEPKQEEKKEQTKNPNIIIEHALIKE